MSLKIATESLNPHVTKISLEGRLDTNTTAQLDEALTGVLGGPTTNVVFDLEKLEYISSAGLRAIFRTRVAMEKKPKGSAVVVHLQPAVKKVFEIVQALPGQSIFSSWDEVDAYLDVIQKKVREGEE